jgi:hypothetical protein
VDSTSLGRGFEEPDFDEQVSLPPLLIDWANAAPPSGFRLPGLSGSGSPNTVFLIPRGGSGGKGSLGSTSTGGSDTEVDIGLPFLPPSRLAEGLGNIDISPPTDALLRWTWPSQEGLRWDAVSSRREGEWTILEGQVDIQAEGDRIQADLVRLNEKTKKLFAEGNVVLDHLDSRLAGSRMEYDLVTNTGTVWDVIGYTGTDINFTGERAEKISDDKFVVYNGSFTSCTQPLPIWQIRASKALIHIDKFVYTWNPRIFFKKVPAYYLPWAAFPIRQERTTGFMIPKISSSSLRGTSVAEEYFWAINRSVDLTLGARWWDKYGYRADVEARWHLDGMPSSGYFKGAFLDAKEADVVQGTQVEEQRWHARFEHRQKLWESWDLTVRGEVGSDQLVDDEFIDFNNATPVFNQRISLQRRWGKHALNIYLENDERERGTPASSTLPGAEAESAEKTNTNTNQRLPELEYRLSGLQLGGAKWASLQMEASLGALRRNINDQYDAVYGTERVQRSVDTADHDYWRADIYPQLRFPLGTSFLEVVPSFNVRGTYWSRQETGDTETDTLFFPLDPPGEIDSVNASITTGVDEGLFLWGWDAGVRLAGPDLERIYKKAALPGQHKWQHLIEPEIDVRYTPKIEEESIISGDRRRSHYQGRFTDTGARGTFRLVNTLRNKLVTPVGASSEQARDWLIWRLSIDYDFRKKASDRDLGDSDFSRAEASHWSDVRSDFNWRPRDEIRFSLRNTFDILQDDVTSTSLVGGVDGDWGYSEMSFTSRRSSTTLEDTNTELAMTGETWFYKNDRIRLGWDFTKSFNGSVVDSSGNKTASSWPYKRVVASYFNQCCGVQLSWSDNDDRSIRREKEWSFQITLKDLGNYLRYRKKSTDQ